MKITIISFALVTMTFVVTEALTLHARGSATASSGQGKNEVDTSLSSMSHTVKRTTPDYSSSSLMMLKDRLVTKRQDMKGTEQVYTCQAYIDGIESVLVSIEKSMTQVHNEVDNDQSTGEVLAKLEEIENLVAQTRTDNDAAKMTDYTTQTTIDTFVSTTTSLQTKLGENEALLGEASKSEAYSDLKMNADNIESYAKEYVEKGCVTAV